MIIEFADIILQGTEGVRSALSQLRGLMKEKAQLKEAREFFSGHQEELVRLLTHEDAKTRKNAALLIGDLGELKVQELPDQEKDGQPNMDLTEQEKSERRYVDLTEALWNAYGQETTLFVKASYLEALSKLNCEDYLPQLRTLLQELRSVVPAEGDRKHIDEQLRILTKLILASDGMDRHRFTGWHEPVEILLTTNRQHQEVTMEQLCGLPDILSANCRRAQTGVLVKTDHLQELQEIRTYEEMLFLIPGMKSCDFDAAAAAQKIAGSKLLDFLQRTHQGKPPFYFRMELRSKLPLDKKTQFLKKCTSELERLTERRLINDASHYEIEIRLAEVISKGIPERPVGKAGGSVQHPSKGRMERGARSTVQEQLSCNCYIVLHTIQDHRFDYRQQVTPTGLKPVNAALLAELARPYLCEDAQVLDPFCGVGTMLIERQMTMKANTSYGIDIYGDAIEKARINTEAAGQIVHYINKDFFEFEHEYRFDEIYTDMPYVTGRKTEDEIYQLYQRFFREAPKYLYEHGRMILYTRDEMNVRSLAKANGIRVLEAFQIVRKDNTWLFILEV